MAGNLRIGTVASAAGTNVETVRYYERIGLLPPPARTGGNYRAYDEADARRLAFIRHARALGFEIIEIRSLLTLSDDPGRDCAEADRIASEHLATVKLKLARLTGLRDELARIVGVCRGGRAATCRVLEAVSDHGGCTTNHDI